LALGARRTLRAVLAAQLTRLWLREMTACTEARAGEEGAGAAAASGAAAMAMAMQLSIDAAAAWRLRGVGTLSVSTGPQIYLSAGERIWTGGRGRQ
jgi:hypothetical protein